VSREQWFKSVILATQKIEIRRIIFQDQAGQKVYESQTRPMVGAAMHALLFMQEA
jgi:hypothetical protein